MTTRCAFVPAAVSAALLAGAAPAGTPSYDTHQLQARTNFAVNPGGSFNIPPDHFFSGEDIKVNNNNEVAFHVGVTPTDQPKVWFGSGGTGGIVYTAPVDAFMSNVSLNDSGFVIWEETFVTTDGLYFYDSSDSSSGFLMNRPLGATDWGSPQVNNSGLVGFRGKLGFSGNAHISWDPALPTSTVEHALENGLDPGSPYSFLFTPSFNNNRQIASKTLLTSGPEEVRIFNADGTSILIAEDTSADPGSMFTGFDNSVSLNDNEQVAFVADLVGGDRAVVIGDASMSYTIVAAESDAEISDIEFFAPSLNNEGQVAFRAFDSSGLRAIWVGNGDDLVRVVTEHDILATDLGDGRVDQHDSSPVFGGGPDINDDGDVAFNCGLTPPDNNQIEWGSGVYVASPTVPCEGDADGSGTVDVNDVSYVIFRLGDTGAPGEVDGDANGDGTVDANDISFVIFRLGPCP